MNLLRRVVLRLIGVEVKKSRASYPAPEPGERDYEQLWAAYVAESQRRHRAEQQLQTLLDALEFGNETDEETEGR